MNQVKTVIHGTPLRVKANLFVKKFTQIADQLDKKGFYKEADRIGFLVKEALKSLVERMDALISKAKEMYGQIEPCNKPTLYESFIFDDDNQLTLWFNLPSGTTKVLIEGQQPVTEKGITRLIDAAAKKAFWEKLILDQKGFYKEADEIDEILQGVEEKESEEKYLINITENFKKWKRLYEKYLNNIETRKVNKTLPQNFKPIPFESFQGLLSILDIEEKEEKYNLVKMYGTVSQFEENLNKGLVL